VVPPRLRDRSEFLSSPPTERDRGRPRRTWLSGARRSAVEAPGPRSSPPRNEATPTPTELRLLLLLELRLRLRPWPLLFLLGSPPLPLLRRLLLSLVDRPWPTLCSRPGVPEVGFLLPALGPPPARATSSFLPSLSDKMSTSSSSKRMSAELIKTLRSTSKMASSSLSFLCCRYMWKRVKPEYLSSAGALP